MTVWSVTQCLNLIVDLIFEGQKQNSTLGPPQITMPIFTIFIHSSVIFFFPLRRSAQTSLLPATNSSSFLEIPFDLWKILLHWVLGLSKVSVQWDMIISPVVPGFTPRPLSYGSLHQSLHSPLSLKKHWIYSKDAPKLQNSSRPFLILHVPRIYSIQQFQSFTASILPWAIWNNHVEFTSMNFLQVFLVVPMHDLTI